MTFASPLNESTPQSVWEEQEALGGRLMLTIPFGASVDNMQGFVSVMGTSSEECDSFPVLTVCVGKPAGGAIVSTLVFPTSELYLGFIDSMHCDAYSSFERTVGLIEN